MTWSVWESPTVDLLMQVEHLPSEEEILRADGFSVQGGGPVATAIVALARLGAANGDDRRPGR